jgi:hypothetical protein
LPFCAAEAPLWECWVSLCQPNLQKQAIALLTCSLTSGWLSDPIIQYRFSAVNLSLENKYLMPFDELIAKEDYAFWLELHSLHIQA